MEIFKKSNIKRENSNTPTIYQNTNSNLKNNLQYIIISNYIALRHTEFFRIYRLGKSGMVTALEAVERSMT